MSRVNPIKNIKDERMFVQYLDAHYPREALFWRVTRNSGYRISDVLNFTVYDAKEIIANNKFIIQEQKTGKKREVVLTNELRKALEAAIKNKRDYEKLFRSRQGQNKSASSRQIGRVLKQAAHDVGLKENIGTHSGRKTFGYYMAKSRGIEFVQALFQHSTQRVTMEYTGIWEEIQDKAILNDLPSLE